MKKLLKISLFVSLFTILLASSVMASSEKYLLTKELTYESTRTVTLKNGFVEILIGKMNFVQYQKDDGIVITPSPDEIREDEFGNVYAYYNLEGLRPNQKFKITVKRDVLVSSYEEIIPSRTNSVINQETSQFVKPAEGIESDYPEIIAKAKEITEGQSTDYKKAQAIFEYVNTNMTYDTSSNYANKGSVSAFKNMSGVCEEFATLFGAMSRAVGIPTRLIKGYKVENKKSGDSIIDRNLVNHVWCEIYLEEFGWVPVEPTVVYLVNGERRAFLDSFCQMKSIDHIAIGLYNYSEANRRMKNVDEVEFKESVILSEDILPEVQNSFKDINNFEWAKDDIQSLFAKEIVLGYSDEEYGPEKNISRIEFMTMLSRLLKYYDTMGTTGGSVYYYPDYDEKHWSKKEYDYLLRCFDLIDPTGDMSIIGYSPITDVFGVGSLNPNKPITRAEVVALMDLFLENISDDITFSDVNASTSFRNSIVKAYANGLIKGYPDGSFRPNAFITRAEMAAILNRYITSKIYNF